jgi:phosphoglycerate dehydrogenase-like enzyme
VANVLVVDPLLLTAEFGVGPGWAGEEPEVVVPGGFELDDLRPGLERADAILTAHAPVTDEMMAIAANLRVISKPGAGVDNIDVGAATTRGVTVTNVTGARGRAVAEHAMFMLLFLVRHGWMRDDPAWQGTTAVQLGGKTLGIAGLGEIGAHLARAGHGLGMRVVAHTRTPDPARVPDVPIAFVDRSELFASSDALILCLPLNDETRHLVDRERLATMRPTAYLINVARGPVVDTADLADALREERLAGAGLDVTDPEPLPPDHELRTMPNVLLSPHNAGRTLDSQREALARMRENVRLVLAGAPPTDPVSPSPAQQASAAPITNASSE